MFDPAAISRIVHMARADGIDPAALLAVAQVESAGRLFEDDGITPRFLFERHVFYRALYRQQRAKLQQAVRAGLAIKKRSPSTQYRDMATSSGRMRALRAARAIDEECANQACSWGLGQILGENAVSLGYGTATAMVETMVAGGIPAQVDSLLRFVRKNGLKDELNRKDFAGFAKVYNGPAYRDFRYDVKMAAGYRKWAAQLDRTAILPPEPEPEAPAAPEPPPPVDEPIDDLPPPYEEPMTVGKSGTLKALLLQIVSGLGAGAAFIFQDRYIFFGCLAFILILILFVGRERILKIVQRGI